MVSRRSLAIASFIGFVASPCLAAPRTLTIWALNEPQWRAVCSDFEKLHRNVKVRLLSGEVDKFYTMVTAGMMPDLWGPWGTPGIHADVNRNWAVEMGSLIQRDTKELGIDDFFPGVMRQFRVAGKQYSLPMISNVDYYFYNTKLYSQAGLVPPSSDAADRSWNWDKMLADAQKLTLRNSNGAIQVAGAEINTYIGSEPNFLHMWGASPYGEDALRSSVPQKVYWTAPNSVKALTKAWELINRYKVANPATFQFQNDKVGGSIEAGTLIPYYMKAKTLKWAIAPLPWGDTNSGTLWPDGLRIGRTSKNKELAWEFIKYVSRPSIMKYMVSDPSSQWIGFPSARKSVFLETLGRDIGRRTGQDPATIFDIQSAMDEAGIVKYQETICIHTDLVPFWEPIVQSLWNNKISPVQAAQRLQDISNRQLPILFQRWIRNIKFTGAENKQK